ncbi:hypothetical protein [Ancylobacter rudongensis]|uniref:Uncharacterized protein n=1 Tax=Ancylobacter rudongensis TaxID=177413 RepID=A0A1G4UP58_9HYPH|nr:hypothetical protein [Ancylobacter rudongensis]SCW95433.1 hypothetical protein SAMN05660859_0027 [Ancylobacter rudongensis]
MSTSEDEVLETQTDGVYTLSLISRSSTEFAGVATYIVRIEKDGGEGERSFPDHETACRAYHETRILCGLPYRAPVFASPPAPQVEPTLLNCATAEEVIAHFTRKLRRYRPGSEEVFAIREEMIACEALRANTGEIAALCVGSDWAAATIRVVCKRLGLTQQQAAVDKLSSVPGFGAFG